MKYLVHILLVTTLALANQESHALEKQDGYPAERPLTSFDENNSILFESKKLRAIDGKTNVRSEFDNDLNYQKDVDSYRIPLITLDSSNIYNPGNGYSDKINQYGRFTKANKNYAERPSGSSFDKYGQEKTTDEELNLRENDILQGGYASSVNSFQFDSQKGYVYEKPKVTFEEGPVRNQRPKIPTTTVRTTLSQKIPSYRPTSIATQPPKKPSFQKPPLETTQTTSNKPSTRKPTTQLPSYRPPPATKYPASREPGTQPPFKPGPVKPQVPTPQPPRGYIYEKPAKPFTQNTPSPSYVTSRPSFKPVETSTALPPLYRPSSKSPEISVTEVPQRPQKPSYRPSQTPAPQSPFNRPTTTTQLTSKPGQGTSNFPSSGIRFEVTQKPTTKQPYPPNRNPVGPSYRPVQKVTPSGPASTQKPTKLPSPIQKVPPSTGYIYDKPKIPFGESPSKFPQQPSKSPNFIPSQKLPAFRPLPSPQSSNALIPITPTNQPIKIPTPQEPTFPPSIVSFKPSQTGSDKPSYQVPDFPKQQTPQYRPSSIVPQLPSKSPNFIPSQKLPASRPSPSPQSSNVLIPINPTIQPIKIPTSPKPSFPSSIVSSKPSQTPSDKPSYQVNDFPKQQTPQYRPSSGSISSSTTFTQPPRVPNRPAIESGSTPTKPQGIFPGTLGTAKPSPFESNYQPSIRPQSKPSSPQLKPSSVPQKSPGISPSPNKPFRPTNELYPSTIQSQPPIYTTNVRPQQPASQITITSLPKEPTGYIYEKPKKPFIESPSQSYKPIVSQQNTSNRPSKTPTLYPQIPSYRPSQVPAFQQPPSASKFPDITSQISTSVPSKTISQTPINRPSQPPTYRPPQTPEISEPNYQPSQISTPQSPIYRPIPQIPSYRPPQIPSSQSPAYRPSQTPEISKPNYQPSQISTPQSPIYRPIPQIPSYRPSQITSSQSPAYRPPQTLEISKPSYQPSQISTPQSSIYRPIPQKPSNSPTQISSSQPSAYRPSKPIYQPSQIPTQQPSTYRPIPQIPSYRPSQIPSFQSPSYKPSLSPTLSIPNNQRPQVPTESPLKYGPSASVPSSDTSQSSKPKPPVIRPTSAPQSSIYPNPSYQFPSKPVSQLPQVRPQPVSVSTLKPQKPISPVIISSAPAVTGKPSTGYIYEKPQKPFVETQTTKPFGFDDRPNYKPSKPSSQESFNRPTQFLQFNRTISSNTTPRVNLAYTTKKPIVQETFSRPSIPSFKPDKIPQKPNYQLPQISSTQIPINRPTPTKVKPTFPPSYPERPSISPQPIQPFQPSVFKPSQPQGPPSVGYVYEKPKQTIQNTLIPSTKPSITSQKPSYQPPQNSAVQASIYRPTPIPKKPVLSTISFDRPSIPQLSSTGYVYEKPTKPIGKIPSTSSEPSIFSQNSGYRPSAISPVKTPTYRPISVSQKPSSVDRLSTTQQTFQPGIYSPNKPTSLSPPSITPQQPVNKPPIVEQSQYRPSLGPQFPKIPTTQPPRKPSIQPIPQYPGFQTAQKPIPSRPSSFSLPSQPPINIYTDITQKPLQTISGEISRPSPSSSSSRPVYPQIPNSYPPVALKPNENKPPYEGPGYIPPLKVSTIKTQTYAPSTLKPITPVITSKPYTLKPVVTTPKSFNFPLTTYKPSITDSPTVKPFTSSYSTVKPNTYAPSTSKTFTNASPSFKPFTFAPSTYKPYVPISTTVKPISLKPSKYEPYIPSTSTVRPQGTTQNSFTYAINTQKQFTFGPSFKPISTDKPPASFSPNYYPIKSQSNKPKPFTFVSPSLKPSTSKPFTYGPSFQPSINTTPKTSTYTPSYKPYQPASTTPSPKFPTFSSITPSRDSLKPFVTSTSRPSTTQEDRHYLPPKSDGYFYPKPEVSFVF